MKRNKLLSINKDKSLKKKLKEITFKNVTFKYKPKEKTNKHMIEFGASKNVTLDSCKFIGNQNLCCIYQMSNKCPSTRHY